MGKDRKIDAVILGLLSHEELTGYDIKKRIDSHIKYFWKGSFGSIYPALSAMESAGLVKRAKNGDSSGRREKIKYAITDIGRDFLQEWLEDTRCTNDLKYETILKLYFGANAATEISIKIINQFEYEIEGELRILKLFRKNLETALEERAHVYFYITVCFGIETYEAYLRWCRLAREMLTKMEETS